MRYIRKTPNFKFLYLFIVLACILVLACNSPAAQAQGWTYEEVLSNSDEYGYVVRWTPNYEEEAVAFQLEVQTRSYVGFGLSKNGVMVGSDIVIGAFWLMDGPTSG